MGKTVGYNSKILISCIDKKTGSNKGANQAEVYHKELPVSIPESYKSHCIAHLMKSSDKPIKETDNQKMLVENTTMKK